MIIGIPGECQGPLINRFDLNSICIKHPSATVFMTVDSSRYMKMGIYNGDLLIIDRTKRICPNSLVIYESEGEFSIGRVFNIKTEALITGVITHVIHTVKET